MTTSASCDTLSIKTRRGERCVENTGVEPPWKLKLTLEPLSLVALDHDAELQHQLRGTF